MSGWLAIAGLGPGAAELVTPEVTQALAQATDLIGYAPYVARVPERDGLVRHGSDNREELDRASLALRLAAEGRRVVVVSSGDPGVLVTSPQDPLITVRAVIITVRRRSGAPGRAAPHGRLSRRNFAVRKYAATCGVSA